MKVITVPPEEKFLFDLLAKAREEGIIIQTRDGEQFVLWFLEGWEAFDVGDSGDFREEVEATAKNKELAEYLAARRSKGKRIPLADVKEQLGLS